MLCEQLSQHAVVLIEVLGALVTTAGALIAFLPRRKRVPPMVPFALLMLGAGLELGACLTAHL